MADDIDSLAAKVALLSGLHNLPEPPSTNELSVDIEEQQGCGRTLTRKHEISIVQQLAFICGYSADPLHVTAVCVEERPDSQSIHIRVAANTGRHEVLIGHLRQAARILEDEANGSMAYPSMLHNAGTNEFQSNEI